MIFLLFSLIIYSAPEPPEPAPLSIVDTIFDCGVGLRGFEPDFQGEAGWNCVNFSNYYYDLHPEWHVLEISDRSGYTHAVNYMIIEEKIVISDSFWEITYNFTEWQDIELQSWPGHIPAEEHPFMKNV